MAETKRIQSFEEFWPFYVGEHRSPVCRGLHYFGTGLAVLSFLSGLLTLNPVLLGIAPVLGYGPAWIGHFFIEGNRPATFTYPRWSFMADFRMLSFALRGKMRAEVTRLYASPNPSRQAPLLAVR